MQASSYITAILALILVLGLILALAWVMRRLGLGGAATGPLTRKRRLRTIESAMIDGRHRAVLLRRDDVEHLVLVGPNTSQVIETGIPAPTEESAPPSPTGPADTFRQLLRKEPRP